MKVLVACEFSGTVRDAFRDQGHDSWSCDFLPTETPGNHIQGDVLDVLNDGWDLMIAHPPCTYLSVAGMHYLDKSLSRRHKRDCAILFVKELFSCPIPRIAIENPVGVLSSAWRKPDQIVKMNYFGENAYKPTCLWLKNLPPLKLSEPVGVDIVKYPNGRMASAWYASKRKSKDRSKTFEGFARAMAKQWSEFATPQNPEEGSV